jgi:hypothetical protein
MTLRADDGTLLEVKEPVVLGPEKQRSESPNSGSSPGANAQATHYSDFGNGAGPESKPDLGWRNDPFRQRRGSDFKTGHKVKVFDLSKWGFWLAPLAVLAVLAFLFFGTLFLGIFLGIALLVSVLKWILNVFRL